MSTVSALKCKHCKARHGHMHDKRCPMFRAVEPSAPVTREQIIDCLLATQGQSEGVTADAILSLLKEQG